jgi:hypothetical protein
VKLIVLALVQTVLRGVLPYPDLTRRVRVRRRGRALASDPWPQDEAAVTGLDYAKQALLRSLWLQRETRRAVRNRQREAAALLARSSMEVCILGLWCLHDPAAVSRLRASEIKLAPNLLTFLSNTGLIPDAVLRQAVSALGEGVKLPDVRSMAGKIDSETGATLAIHLYDQAYRPASQYFTHATGSSLLRHLRGERRRSSRPVNPWIRRAPLRLADACVGLLAGAVAERVEAPTELFVQYAEAHAGRVLPPFLVTIGKGLTRRLSAGGVIITLKNAGAVRAYLSGRARDETTTEREARLRNMYDALLARLDLEVPPEAIRPVVDHFVAMVLSEWDAEFAARAPRPSGIAAPGCGRRY